LSVNISLCSLFLKLKIETRWLIIPVDQVEKKS
jgi:hypothetical protein